MFFFLRGAETAPRLGLSLILSDKMERRGLGVGQGVMEDSEGWEWRREEQTGKGGR